MISAAENSNEFPKTRFCKEKSVEDVVTHLAQGAHATLVSYDSKAKMSRKISTLGQDAKNNFNSNKSAQNYSNLKSK